MHAVPIAADADLEAFRGFARRALALGLAPHELVWSDEPSLLPPLPQRDGKPFGVPRAFAELAADAACHRAPERFALLYEALWRLKHGEPTLMEVASDPLVARLKALAGEVRREVHKMHAFVRFERRQDEGGEIFVAWFEPEHFVLKQALPFFVERFPSMRWLILTPQGAALWTGAELVMGPPAQKPAGVGEDPLNELWRTYYRAIFNPARLNAAQMRSQMAKRYWKNLPEAEAIPALVAGARTRVERMVEAGPGAEPRFAARVMPHVTPRAAPADDLAALAAEAKGCTRCPLYAPATQTVFGEGPRDAPVVFVGEQPGDQEDLQGRPFVGPAGQLFDRALAEAGVERNRTYVTNAVKHFKFEPRGKRRIHSKPNAGEISACRWWLDQELGVLRPKLVVAMGATAVTSLLGKAASITSLRGRDLELRGLPGLVTVHPSFLLRLPDPEAKRAEYARFVADLQRVAERIPEVRRAA
jgi:DNA polymerase